ncbi:MAG TPA: phytoene desaturase family protein [Flexilinea sp.]|nr:phytoene desaturase family protein [Flexilinea sp.]
MKPLNVIIIGAGLGGLACGIRLAVEGCKVKIFEKNLFAGGSLGSIRLKGFTFNTGAEYISAPFLFDQLYEYAGKRRIDSFKFRDCDPIFQAVFPDFKRFALYSNPAETVKLNPMLSGADLQGFNSFTEESAAIFDDIFFDYCGRPVDENTFRFRTNLWLRRMNPQKTCEEYANEKFQTPELQQLFGFWPLIGGGNPKSATHLFRAFSQMFQRWGTAVPDGGMDNMVQAIVRLFRESGGEIFYGTEVSEIQIFNHTVSGVRLKDGRIQQADLVISDADAAATYRYLIDSDRTRYDSVNQAKTKISGISAFVYHLGTRCILQERAPLAPLNILFPEDYDRFLNELFDQKTLSDHPLLILRMASKIIPDNAPFGCEALSVIVPVPNLESINPWDHISYSYRNHVLDLLQNYFLTDIRTNLIVEEYLDPIIIKNRLGSHAGSILSFQPELQKNGEIRMANRCRDIRHLYLAGNGAHPGATIPGVLLGAANTVQVIKEDFDKE